eukprot:COSAG01_NODE_833_length_13236_cov_1041.341022_7_plen_81_part_00
MHAAGKLGTEQDGVADEGGYQGESFPGPSETFTIADEQFESFLAARIRSERAAASVPEAGMRGDAPEPTPTDTGEILLSL